MSSIKDISDLIGQLLNSGKDRKLAAEIAPIQSLISMVQSDHFAMVEKNAELLSQNLELKKKISELENTISRLVDKQARKITELVEDHTKEVSCLKKEIDNLTSKPEISPNRIAIGEHKPTPLEESLKNY